MPRSLAPCLAGPASCRGVVPVDAPLPLCELHLTMAAEWAERAVGITDLLPSPCRLCGSSIGVRYPSGWICGVCEWRVGDVVDAELPPPRVDVVYYLRSGDRVKIGTTANPRQRLAAIWHDQLLAFERGDRRVEQRRHAQFAADRLGGEWFRLSIPVREHIAVVAAGVDDPWDAHARWVSAALALRG
ncbi:GIY-YIG nuclease family protein [Lysobacter korlensis]|uniref:GIY-YIG nuclease family protein n=1 Tax=Lysobacter korlensis TaxID=553636 RepID=A0ABV6S069_9GAMM